MRSLHHLFVALAVTQALCAQELSVPDPLRMENGERVTTAEQWVTKRRPELLEIFRTQVYGRAPDGMQFALSDSVSDAMDGKRESAPGHGDPRAQALVGGAELPVWHANVFKHFPAGEVHIQFARAIGAARSGTGGHSGHLGRGIRAHPVRAGRHLEPDGARPRPFPRAFSMWLAGGGVKPGTIYGASDDFAYHAV